MPFLDDLLGVQDITANGVGPHVARAKLNIVAPGATVTDNRVTGVTTLTIPGVSGDGALAAMYAANDVVVGIAGDGGDVPTPLNMPPSTTLARLASGDIVAASVADMQALLGIGPANTAGAVPIHVPPRLRGLSAGGLDDEFDSTTIDPSWVFRDVTTGPTNRTPNFGALSENTDLTGATTPPSVALHTQGRRSFMLVQTTVTGPAAYWVYKPFTWAAGQYYYTRASSLLRKQGTTPGTGATVWFTMWASSGGLPDPSNLVSIAIDPFNGTYRWALVVSGTPSNSTVSYNEGMGIPEYMGIGNPAGVLGSSANWYGEFFGDDGRRIQPVASGFSSFSWTPAFIGYRLSNSLGKPWVAAIDFVRENAGHPLFHL